MIGRHSALIGFAALVLAVGFVNIALGRMDGVTSSPDSCREDAVESLLRSFAGSLSDGSIAGEVDDYFSSDRFSWYSVQGPGERLESESRDRSTLAQYFANRVELGETMEIVSFESSYDAGRNLVHLRKLYLRRSAADIDGQLNVEGKGAVDCTTGKITALSIGDLDSTRMILVHNIRSAALFIPSGILAYIFGLSGLLKLRDPLRSSIAMVRFGLRRRIDPSSGRTLGALELLLAVCLVFIPMFPLVPSGALLLLLAFCALHYRALSRGRSFDCGCFGRPDPITWQTLTRTSLMAIVALTSLVVSWRYSPSSSLSAAHAMGTTMAILGASVVSLLNDIRSAELFRYSLTLQDA